MICRAVLPVALAAFIPLLVASNRMGAQSAVRGAIVGKVTSDSAGSHGVANAEILVPALDINTRTGETGEYRVAVAPGRYLVMVRVPGFKSATDSVTVTAAVDAPLNFVLHAAAVQLDSVVTNATPKKYISGNLNDFEERMHSHGGLLRRRLGPPAEREPALARSLGKPVAWRAILPVDIGSPWREPGCRMGDRLTEWRDVRVRRISEMSGCPRQHEPRRLLFERVRRQRAHLRSQKNARGHPAGPQHVQHERRCRRRVLHRRSVDAGAIQ